LHPQYGTNCELCHARRLPSSRRDVCKSRGMCSCGSRNDHFVKPPPPVVREPFACKSSSSSNDYIAKPPLPVARPHHHLYPPLFAPNADWAPAYAAVNAPCGRGKHKPVVAAAPYTHTQTHTIEVRAVAATSHAQSHVLVESRLKLWHRLLRGDRGRLEIRNRRRRHVAVGGRACCHHHHPVAQA